MNSPSPILNIASGGQWRPLSGGVLTTTPASAPAIVATDYANDILTVTLAQPLNSGGTPITGYAVTAVPTNGAPTALVSGTGTTLNLMNLVIGFTYTLTATATNAVGTSQASASVSVAIPMRTYVKPEAYNTGYPHSLPGDTRTPATLTPISGDDFETLIQATAGNTTIANYAVSGGFNLRRNNITFQNCRFIGVPSTTSNAGSPMMTAGGSPAPTTVNFIDCELAGNGVPQHDPNGDLNHGWAYSEPCNLTTQNHLRSDIWGFGDGIREVSDSRYESCYIHDLTFYYTASDSTHNDGLQIVGEVDNFMIIGCNFELGDTFGLSSVFQYNSAGVPNTPRTRICFVSNWWEGNSFYAISGVPDLSKEDFSMLMAYNRFSPHIAFAQIWYPDPGWPNALAQGKLTMVDNEWDATGTTSYGAAVTQGSLIPYPTG